MDPRALRWARLACREDHLGCDSQPLRRRWGPPLRLASMGAFPTMGAAGMRELDRRLPPEGAVFLISGPHVAIAEDGSWGFGGPGGCAALAEAYARLERPPAFSGFDLEAEALEGALRAMPPPRFRGPDAPLELSLHAARVSERVLARVLDRRSPPRLIWASGLVIKSPAGSLFAPLQLRLRGLPPEAAAAWEARQAPRPLDPDP